MTKNALLYICRERERERAIRTGTFVTKKGHFGNMGTFVTLIANFCHVHRELFLTMGHFLNFNRELLSLHREHL